ncbi:MAG: Deoxyribose-phosphate aldolase, partial [Actinomycetota bacterium]
MQLPSLLSDATKNEESLKKFLNGLSGVDKVGVEERAAKLSTRSIKTTAKKEGIDLSIRMIDLTTLEGMDTKGKVKTLCSKARRPDPLDNSVPSVAAVCVYSDLVSIAKENLTGTNIKVA